MKTLTKTLSALLILTMLFSVLTACADSDTGDSTNPGDQTVQVQPDETPDTEEAGDRTDADGQTASGEPADTTLIIGVTDANGTHDPNANATTAYQMDTVFEKLMTVNPVTGELVPQLAESVEYLDDTTLEIKLRQDVYFTDGQQMTARDVFYCYRDLHALGNSSNMLESFDWETSGIVDDFTIHFVLSEPYGPAISILSDFYIFCYDDLFEGTSDADKWLLAPNGTGPYYCASNVDSSEVIYARKDAADYWGGSCLHVPR